MKYRTLGRTGLRVSEVSLGGAYIGGTDPERRRQNAAELVARAQELGVNYIDTAPLYGDSEELLGPALAAAGKPVQVATKVGFDPEDFDYSEGAVLRSLERSLRRLGVERLAAAQIHEVNLAGWECITGPGGTLEGLRAAQKLGMCDFIGITGRAIPLLARLAATGEFDTVLVYHDYHPVSQLAAEAVIPAAAAAGMGIVVATILAGGLFGYSERRDAVLAGLEPEERSRAAKVLEQLRRQPGALPQNAFRWVLADDRVSTACSGAGKIAELEEVAAASEMPPFDRGAATGAG